MEFIEINNNNEIVKIKISISYVGPCKYIYVVAPDKFFNYSTADVPLKPFPHIFEIGDGKNILLPGNDSNNWSIQIMNPSDKDLDYELSIEWYQGINTAPVYTWPQDTKARKGVIKAHVDHILFSGNCNYES